MPRDDFPNSVRVVVMIRAGLRCSRPDCGVVTTGPHVEPEKWLTLGEVAHITAASPGGPRYDASLSPDQRSGLSNAIWLCRQCAKLIDAEESRHSVEELRAWKAGAEARARVALELNRQPLDASGLSAEALQMLIAAGGQGVIYRLDVQQLTYPIIRVGCCDFFSTDDPLVGAAYVDGLESLVDFGLARHESGCLYTLSSRAMRLGRAISDSLRPK